MTTTIRASTARTIAMRCRSYTVASYLRATRAALSNASDGVDLSRRAE